MDLPVIAHWKVFCEFKLSHRALSRPFMTKKAIQPTKKTFVTGYFNPQKYSIYIEISAINLKSELAPGAYIQDANGKYFNDPIFEAYVHPRGLARTTIEESIPIHYVPRAVREDTSKTVRRASPARTSATSENTCFPDWHHGH